MKLSIHEENHVDKLISVLQQLKSKKVRVGVLGTKNSDMVEIAYAHEFGADIRPKNKKSLAIPIDPRAHNKKPSDFKGLFRLGNTKLLGIKTGKKGTFQPLFMLANSVHIPERSFIRGAFDSNKEKIVNYAQNQLSKVLSLEIAADEFYNQLGVYCVGIVKKYITSLSSPEDSELTKTVKGSDNPLMDIGRLRNSITYEIVEG